MQQALCHYPSGRSAASSRGYGKKGMKGYGIDREADRQRESCLSKRGSSSSTGAPIPTSDPPCSPRSSQSAQGSLSAARQYAPGSWRKGNGRNTANTKPTVNGARGRIDTERCYRWTVSTMTVLSAEDRTVC